jgi:hypothetical protein
MQSNNALNNAVTDAIGSVGYPRIAVVQTDLLPRVRGDIVTLTRVTLDSFLFSWENVAFSRDRISGDGVGNVNAQAELFANGAVNICYGQGDIAGKRFAAGIEGGVNDPYWTEGAVQYPLPDDQFFSSDGITVIWPTNTCYCFTPGEEWEQA